MRSSQQPLPVGYGIDRSESPRHRPKLQRGGSRRSIVPRHAQQMAVKQHRLLPFTLLRTDHPRPAVVLSASGASFAGSFRQARLVPYARYTRNSQSTVPPWWKPTLSSTANSSARSSIEGCIGWWNFPVLVNGPSPESAVSGQSSRCIALEWLISAFTFHESLHRALPREMLSHVINN